MDHSCASELLGAYALDACDAAETAALEQHLVECIVCAGEAGRLTNLAGWIGVSESIAPPDAMRCWLVDPNSGGRFLRPIV